MREQIEQIKLNEQINVIINELIKISADKNVINTTGEAVGKIATIELSWGMLLILDLAVLRNYITNNQANDIIRFMNNDVGYRKEMLKDLKFIKLEDDLKLK